MFCVGYMRGTMLVYASSFLPCWIGIALSFLDHLGVYDEDFTQKNKNKSKNTTRAWLLTNVSFRYHSRSIYHAITFILLSTWFQVVFGPNNNFGAQRFSQLEILTKCQYFCWFNIFDTHT